MATLPVAPAGDPVAPTERKEEMVLTLRGRRPSRLAGLVAVVTLAFALAACGGDDKDAGAEKQGQKAEAVDKAFLTGMVHHHDTAVEMAEIAQRRGQDPFVRKLAETIITTQEREIGQMRSIHSRLFDAELKPDPGAHGGLGLTAAAAGMTHDKETNAMLEAAEPFDRAFVDEMVPHHLGAIKMAKVALKDTEDPALRNLAETIVRTQQREVEAMNAFRERKYGSPVPSKTGDDAMMGGAQHESH